MSTVNDIIKQRHTTRLMAGPVKPEDIETIFDSARRAPSKNKIYGYKVFALGESKTATELKKQLCDSLTTCEGSNNETIYLMQTLAPLVLVYMANPAPEHQMVGIVNEETGTEVFDRDYSEVSGEVTRYIMTKSSVRDAMISATYAQLTAEDLGYGTAFVACGVENLMHDSKFIELWKKEFGSDYKNKPVDPIVMVCIGPKDQKIVDLFKGDSSLKQEEYKDGVTHYIRSGREESFAINKKQLEMIVTV
jgi:nitroreductase